MTHRITTRRGTAAFGSTDRGAGRVGPLDAFCVRTTGGVVIRRVPAVTTATSVWRPRPARQALVRDARTSE